MMDTYFVFWTWLILALLLAAGELALPGMFLIWLAGAAGLTGIITAVTGFNYQTQLVTFAIFAVASIYLGRAYFKRNPIQTEDNGLNQRGHRMVGNVVTVVEEISASGGKVQIGDAPWIANGPNLAVGAKARIVRVEGSHVVVEAV
jgi:inner membrane protein